MAGGAEGRGRRRLVAGAGGLDEDAHHLALGPARARGDGLGQRDQPLPPGAVDALAQPLQRPHRVEPGDVARGARPPVGEAERARVIGEGAPRLGRRIAEAREGAPLPQEEQPQEHEELDDDRREPRLLHRLERRLRARARPGVADLDCRSGADEPR